MNLLQYTSDEMYSSTELIRKSKNIFDKLSKRDIEKAIILRDGKPSFLLLDFNMYEKIMKDYIKLKEDSNPKKFIKKETSNKPIEKISTVSKITKEEKVEIEADELKNALDQIDKLTFGSNVEVKKEEKNDPQLKDFWE